MAGVWKGRAEWIDEKSLEADEEEVSIPNGSLQENGAPGSVRGGKAAVKGSLPMKKKRVEKLVVGWGDAAWVLHVHPGGAGVGKDVGERSVGSADIVH
ncbi:Vacuolar protein sorting-associated protein 41, partial [Cryomyces antarcticus]